MIEIKKGAEPAELLTYRLKKDIHPSYNDMKGAKISQFIEGGTDENLYDIVLNALAKEQGYLCAYCMKRIPQRRKFPQMTIEHINPQNSINAAEALNYRNMVAVCNGNRNAKDNKKKTCDAKRGSLPSDEQNLVLNPLIPSSLKNICYLENGEIFSPVKEEEDCIKNVLNLNSATEMLPDARKSALIALQEKINQEYPGRTAPKSYFESLLEHYRTQNPKTPYVGILISWLEKKI